MLHIICCNMHLLNRSYYIENIVTIPSNRIEVNLEEQETHITLSDNYLIEWNSSRKIFHHFVLQRS